MSPKNRSSGKSDRNFNLRVHVLDRVIQYEFIFSKRKYIEIHPFFCLPLQYVFTRNIIDATKSSFFPEI